jgi:hypothetical protein
MARGDVERRTDGEWLLRGAAPDTGETGNTSGTVRFQRA